MTSIQQRPQAPSTPPAATVAPRPPGLWYTHSYNRPTFYRLIARCAPWLPRPLRFALARATATYVQRWMPREVAAVQSNLRRVLPTATPQALTQHTRALFQNFACFFTDLLSLNRSPLPLQQRYLHAIHGQEHIAALLAAPRGFVVATAHLGNWELAGRLLSTQGRTVHVLMAPEQEATLHALLRHTPASGAMRFADNTGSTNFVQLLMALRKGDIVAVQMDRATGHRSDVQVPFFGVPTVLPLGPLRLASAAQVPVVPCYCLMRADTHYEIYVGAPLTVTRGNEEAALHSLVQVMEHYIALAPEQWYNFYDVWHTPTAV